MYRCKNAELINTSSSFIHLVNFIHSFIFLLDLNELATRDSSPLGFTSDDRHVTADRGQLEVGGRDFSS